MKLGSDITARNMPQTQRGLADYLGEYLSISQAIEKMSGRRQLSAKEQMELEKMRASQKVYGEIIKGIIDFGKELGVAMAPGLRDKILSLAEKREMPPPPAREDAYLINPEGKLEPVSEEQLAKRVLPPEQASIPPETTTSRTQQDSKTAKKKETRSDILQREEF